MDEHNTLAGKVAIVTGASSGLGREIAIVYARNGVNVVAAARRKPELDKLVRELTKSYGGKHIAVATDITSRYSVQALFDTAIASYGKFDIVVNSAGNAYLWPLESHTPEQVLQLNSVLVNGNALMHLYGITHLKRFLREGKIENGIIIDVLSSSAQDLYEHNGVYGPAKEYMSKLSRLNQQDNPELVFIRLYPSNFKSSLINEKTASPKVYAYIKNAPKLETGDIALVVRKLTEDGKSDDVYMEKRDDDGNERIVIDRLTHIKPSHAKDEALLEYVLRRRK